MLLPLLVEAYAALGRQPEAAPLAAAYAAVPLVGPPETSALALFLSPKTIEHHLTTIFR
jgi:hypothetical protein